MSVDQAYKLAKERYAWCVQAVVIGGFLWLVYILVKRLVLKGKEDHRS